jgi:hypothetical protein
MPKPFQSSQQTIPQPNVLDSPASASENALPVDFMAEASYIPANVDDGMNGDAAGGVAAVVNLIPPELIAQALSPSFRALFNAVAAKRGEFWELKEFETKALVTGWTPIVQHLLSRLGSSEQVMMTLAIGSTVAIVGGKVAQEGTHRRSSQASTKTPESAASSVSSVSAAPANQPSHGPLYTEHGG